MRLRKKLNKLNNKLKLPKKKQLSKFILLSFIFIGLIMIMLAIYKIKTTKNLSRKCLYDTIEVDGNAIEVPKEVEKCFDIAQFEAGLGIMVFVIGLVGYRVRYERILLKNKDEEVIKWKSLVGAVRENMDV